MAKAVRIYKDAEALIEELEQKAVPKYRENMPKFGIEHVKSLGVPVPEIRKIAKSTAESRGVAMELWKSGLHEAMILSTMIFPPAEVSVEDAEKMVKDIVTWDLCDHFTGNLIAPSRFVMEVMEFCHSSEEELVKRAAFSLIAQLDQKVWYTPRNVRHFISLIKEASSDGRNFVRKAVSWALREIGKSSPENWRLAVAAANEIIAAGTKASLWIGRDAKRELSSKAVRKRLEIYGTKL